MNNQSMVVLDKTPGRIVKLPRSTADVALRILHTETHNQLMDELKMFKGLLNDKGLPDSRGDRIYECVQSQVYQKFGLSSEQRKALKGDSKRPLLDFLTSDQVVAIRETKSRLLRIYRVDREHGASRDVTKKKVREALDKAWEYHRDVFEG